MTLALCAISFVAGVLVATAYFKFDAALAALDADEHARHD